MKPRPDPATRPDGTQQPTDPFHVGESAVIMAFASLMSVMLRLNFCIQPRPPGQPAVARAARFDKNTSEPVSVPFVPDPIDVVPASVTSAKRPLEYFALNTFVFASVERSQVKSHHASSWATRFPVVESN